MVLCHLAGAVKGNIYNTCTSASQHNIFITAAAELASLEQRREHPRSNEDMQITLNTCVAKTYTQLDMCIPPFVSAHR